MGTYYNKTSGSLPISTPKGAFSVPGRSRITLAGEDESAPALLAYIQRGFMVRLPDLLPQKEAVAVVLPSIPEVVSVPAEVPAVEALVAATASVSMDEPISRAEDSPTAGAEPSLDDSGPRGPESTTTRRTRRTS